MSSIEVIRAGGPLWTIRADYTSKALSRAAYGTPGIQWDSKTRSGTGYVDGVLTVIRRLEAEGIRVRAGSLPTRPSSDHNLPAALKDARDYQKAGINFLIANAESGALLADDMGCVDGDAVIHANRCDRGFKIKLKDLYYKFNGGKTRNRSWDRSFPTLVRALRDNGELRLHPIEAIFDKGDKRVLQLTLASGKSLRLTADHEVRTTVGFVRADKLTPKHIALTNGRPTCKRCGTKENVATYKYGSFPGYCKPCIHRYLKKHSTSIGGKHKDKDGYVRVSGMHDHPAHHNGNVPEHRLVMEKHIGRYLTRHEVVHHMNGVKDDNRIENLELMFKTDHATHHGMEGGFTRMNGGIAGRGGEVWFTPVEDPVLSVKPDGIARVYDIVCADPYRNFVANGIVVHNCGKSLQAARAARALRGKVVIVTLAYGKHVWVDEIAKWWPAVAKNLQVLSGVKDITPIDPDTQIVVINYDIVYAWEEALLKWVADPISPPKLDGPTLDAPPLIGLGDRFGLIIDEIHLVSNAESRRGQALHRIRKAAAWCVGLSGTPLTNKPVNLFGVIELISPRRMSRVADNPISRFFPYGLRYCGGHQVEISSKED